MKKQAIFREKALASSFIWVLACCLVLTSSVGAAKTLYVTGSSEYPNWDIIWAYNVESNGKLTFQADSLYFDGGALSVNGLTMDPDSKNLIAKFQ